MGLQIIKQPNGKYCLFSSNNYQLIGLDHTREEVIEQFAEDARKRAEEDTRKLLDLIDAGKNPYYQFAKTFDEAVSIHREHKANSSDSWNATVEKTIREMGRHE